MMNCSFLEVEDSRWTEFLGRCAHGPHHLPGYVALAASHEGGRPCAFWAKEDDHEFLLPLLVHEIPPELCNGPPAWDAATPYGCASPLIYPLSRNIGEQTEGFQSSSTCLAAKLLQCMVKACTERQLISVFASSCPMVTLPIDAFKSVGALVRHADTVYVDLSLNEEELMGQLRKSLRYDVRRLEKNGFRAEIDDYSQLPIFADLYNKSMRRLNADSFYMIGLNYFERLKQISGLDVHLCSVLTPQNEVVFSGIYMHRAGIIDAFLTGIDDKHLSLSVGKLAYVEMIKWSKKKGYKLFHLGGGVGGEEDSLLRYKQGFSPQSAPFYTWRVVCCKERYDSLVKRARILDDTPPPEGFFPQYRRTRAAS